MTDVRNTSFSWPKKLPFIKKVGLGAGILVGLSAASPFVKFWFFNNPSYLSLLNYSVTLGIIVLVCGAVGCILSVLGKYAFCLIPGTVSLGAVAAYHITLHKMLLSTGPIEISRLFVKQDTGYYLLIIGTVGLIAVGAVGVLIRTN